VLANRRRRGAVLSHARAACARALRGARASRPRTATRALERDTLRPLLAQGDRRETLSRLAARARSLYAEVADMVFASDGLGVDDAVRRLKARLAQAWHRSEVA
jgi:hypothetical protein